MQTSQKTNSQSFPASQASTLFKTFMLKKTQAQSLVAIRKIQLSPCKLDFNLRQVEFQ